MSFVKRLMLPGSPMDKTALVDYEHKERAALLMKFGCNWTQECWNRHPDEYMSAAEARWEMSTPKKECGRGGGQMVATMLRPGSWVCVLYCGDEYIPPIKHLWKCCKPQANDA